MRLFVVVQGDEIIVTSETGFRAEYLKRPNHSQLKVRRCTDTENHELLARRGSSELKGARVGMDCLGGVAKPTLVGKPSSIACTGRAAAQRLYA
jgi:hypothetical protein